MTTAIQNASTDFAQELRTNVLAIELTLQRVGRRRSMNVRQRDEVADHFGAQRRAVGGSKKLYAPNQSEIKKIASVLGEARSLWLDRTVGYRKGIRLLRKENLAWWTDRFQELQSQLDSALREADEHYQEILDASERFLGSELFDRNDYPATFVGSITIGWGVHNFEPSDELLQLAPETYEREQLRVRRQFEAAIAVYEQEAREQMLKLVESLLDKLDAEKAGEKVVYTEAATTNLRDFFDRFDDLGIRSDETLADLVEAARDALGGVTMGQLKRSADKRRTIGDAFDDLKEKLSSLIVAAPVRSFDLEDLD